MTPTFESPATSVTTVPRRGIPGGLWRLAGILAIAHIVALFAGFSQEKSAMLTATADATKATYVEATLGRVLAGGYVESVAFVLFLPVIVFLARAIGRRSEAARWATQTALTAGICYVAITLASGMAAGAAALYGAQHGVTDGATLALVGNVRNFAYYLSLLVLGAHAIGTGIAAVLDGTMKHWVGWGGICTGILLLGGVATEGLTDTADYAVLPWTVWFLGLGIGLIRRGSTTADPAVA
jgi:hypothetical protein